VKQAAADGAFVGATLPRERSFSRRRRRRRAGVLRDAVALGRGAPRRLIEAALAEQAGHRVRLVEVRRTT
jgi:hypothetical protein